MRKVLDNLQITASRRDLEMAASVGSAANPIVLDDEASGSDTSSGSPIFLDDKDTLSGSHFE